MTSGGWGYSQNPFAATQADDADSAPLPTVGSNGAGAWGSAPPPPAVPFEVQQAAAASAPKRSGLFSFGSSGKPPASTTAAALSAAPAVAAFGGSSATDLGRREQEVARREQAVAERERALGAGGAAAGNRNVANFPPFCPFIHHDISQDIPPWNRSPMRFAFLVELLTLLGFFYNTIITLIAMFANAGMTAKWWLIAMIAFLIGVPASWYFWYKSLYNASTTDGSTYAYMKTMIMVLVNIAWCVWMILALDGLGSFSGGIFPMMSLFQAGDSKSVGFGICYIVNVVIWGLAGLGSWVVLGLAIKMYRKGDDARKEYEQSFGPWTRV